MHNLKSSKVVDNMHVNKKRLGVDNQTRNADGYENRTIEKVGIS